MSSGSRVSIPNNVRKVIQSIKEIAGNHSEEEIYALLKECSMDPNETTQKLLFQDTFHEVRRKRDRKKELQNVNGRVSADSRWRSGMQGRGERDGLGNFSSCIISHNAGGGGNATAGKEDGVNQGIERGSTTSSLRASQETNKSMTSVASSLTVMANGPTGIRYGNSTHGPVSQLPAGSAINPPQESLTVDNNNLQTVQLPATPVQEKNTPNDACGIGDTCAQSTPSSDHFVASMTSTSVSGVYSPASDPVLVPSLDSRHPGVVGTIRREVWSQRTAVEPNAIISSERKSINGALEIGISMDGKMNRKSQGVEKNQLSESLQASSSSTHGASVANRPSSNYSSRSQQLLGIQKAVGPSKEWKPKPTNPNKTSASATVGTSVVAPMTVEAGTRSVPALGVCVSEEATSKLQKKMEELTFSDGQHVIIPFHLQVSEAERTGLSFGSFDASFGVSTSYANGPANDKTSTTLSESSQEIEEIAEEPSSSNQNASSTALEGEYPDHPQSPLLLPENHSPGEVDVSFSAVPEYDQSRQETSLLAEGPQYSVVHTAPNYNFGVMHPMLGSQLAPSESSEPQACDVSPLPGIVVQQPFDPSANYYTQFYRFGADGDGRFSPFLSTGVSTKYNGNIAVLSSQTGQFPQESGNSLVLSTTVPAPLVTQAAGVMQSSMAVTQQPLPVFRQPGGVHLSPYPPNYIPYSHYFPPFYVQPPTVHQFLSNSGFPRHPPTSNIYTPPPPAAATGKYSFSQYKPGNNTGNSTHIGMHTGYGPYSSFPAGYNPSPAVTTRNSTANEDLAASQFKENNVYITGQQSEGSAVWIPAPDQDISGLPASSFYGLPPQGQHVTYAPTQVGHGAYPGIYHHPAQTMAAATVHPLLQQSQTMSGPVEMVGPQAGVYQQPQRAQINWTNNY